MGSTADESVRDISPSLPKGMPLVRVIAMPADTNADGDISGGWLLSQMEVAGGSLAARRALSRCTTAAVNHTVFYDPVFIGDEVSCYGELVKIGRSSMTVRIEAWSRRKASEELRKITETIFIYVAIDEDRRPRPVLPRVGE